MKRLVTGEKKINAIKSKQHKDPQEFVDLSEPEILDIVVEALKIAKYEFF